MELLKILTEEIQNLIRQARYFEAHNEAFAALNDYPDDLRIKQLHALTLARLGATEKALSYVEKIYNSGNTDTETLGILGRVFKDLWIKSGDLNYAKLSRNIYLSSFYKEKNYYTAVNAATMSFLLKEESEGKRIANLVIEMLEPDQLNDYWAYATLGEAYLLIGDELSSLEYYKKAVGISGNNYGDVNSTFRQLKLINNIRKLEYSNEFDELLKPPVILAFSGHMIDHPDRKEPRFPASVEKEVTELIKKKIEELDPKIVYSSIACGSDIIFIELMQKRNAEINLYLPFIKEDFLQTSVSFAGEEWVERFNNILSNNAIKFATEEPYLGDNDLFLYTGNLIMGMSILRANIMGTEPYFLSVIDLSDANRYMAGTLDLMDRWLYRDKMNVIDIGKINKPEIQTKPILNIKLPETKIESRVPFGIKRAIKCIMFADIVGFSRIHEEQTPYFMYELLSIISKGIHKLSKSPDIINTWGDAIFAIYQNASDMMEFASVVSDIILNENWEEKNLPITTNIRIALHVGPVFNGVDPITFKNNAYGTHINRAARMEPVTLPGCIYASEQFASTLIVETGDMYAYEHVGIIELPKQFGKQEVYQISKKIVR